MLHVTNGDCAADVIRAAGLPGAILAWRDVLHEGPVPAPATLDTLRPLRARFLAALSGGAAQRIAAELEDRDRTFVSAARTGTEIVLWFEHDLCDQLQLAQVLDWFAHTAESNATLVQTDDYLGGMGPDEIRPLFDARRPVTADQLRAGSLAWQALASPDPRAISAVRDDVDALPFMAGALTRHLEEFPSTKDGLSRTERQTLEALASGRVTIRDLHRSAHHQRESAIYLGDAMFVYLLVALARGAAPCVRIDGDFENDPLECTVALTHAGADVLEGRQDRVGLLGIDRWLGGVHLRGRRVPYRWDSRTRTIVAEV
jgi:hypothetical protein